MSRWKWTAAVLGFLAVVVMPLSVGWFIWQGLPATKDLGVFAEAFGNIVGPLFAALAFAGLIYTALMQREELSLQRQELRETRAELKRTADAQEASEKALAAQVNVAQLTARLEASQAIFEYYDDLSKRLARKPDMMELVLKGNFFKYRYLVPEALFERDMMEKVDYPFTIEQRYDHFVRALTDARDMAAIEMHRVHDVLREKAQIASGMAVSPSQTASGTAEVETDSGTRRG